MSDQGPPYKLYVAGEKIGNGLEDKDLEEAFEKFGRVIKIWVARQPSGFAFVEYEDKRDAEDAIEKMDNSELLGCTMRVEMSRRRETQHGEVKPGDWPCPKCQINNFARRSECFRCGEYKPRDGGGGGGGGYDRRDDRGYDRGLVILS